MTPAEVETLIRIVADASAVVLEVYGKPFAVEYKAPLDPVTEADRKANELICNRLADAFPNAAIVAEESAPEAYADFRQAERIFFVDPVDGTAEFVQRNGEFVVMIGCVEGDRAVAGVMQAPATGRTWVGHVGHGAFTILPDGTRQPISVSRTATLSDARLVASRSHRTRALERTLESLKVRRIDAQGSAGLKGARVAEGSADAYVAPRYAGSRWDVCPTDALVVAAGGRVTDASGHALEYRGAGLSSDRGLVASNGLVHDAILERLAARR
ncbi:MAG: inositol monophosphatase family protein [Pseudomonadota bacterium]